MREATQRGGCVEVKKKSGGVERALPAAFFDQRSRGYSV
jgi:hypothetical protein